MYHKALEFGLMPSEVDDLSIAELADLLKAKDAAFKEKQKARALISHGQSQEIAYLVSFILSDEKNKPEQIMPYDFYPGLFEDEKKKAEEKEEALILEKQKQVMAMYMAKFNAQFDSIEEGDTDDARRTESNN